MIYKAPCRFCHTVIDHNAYYCPYCGRAHPCTDKSLEAEKLPGPGVDKEPDRGKNAEELFRLRTDKPLGFGRDTAEEK